MSALSDAQWKSIFSQDSRNRAADDFLYRSQGVTTFENLERAIDQLNDARQLEDRAPAGWLEVVKTFGNVSHLDENGNRQCQDVAESICQAFYENESIWASMGDRDRSNFLYQWANIQFYRGNIDKTVSRIIEARQLDPENLTYDLWYTGSLAARGSSEQRTGVTAIRLRLELLGPVGDSNLRAQAHIRSGNAREGVWHYHAALILLVPEGDPSLRAQAHIGLGNAREGHYAQHFRSALDLLGPDGNANLRAQALIGLGNAAIKGGNWIMAGAIFRKL